MNPDIRASIRSDMEAAIHEAQIAIRALESGRYSEQIEHSHRVDELWSRAHTRTLQEIRV